MLTRLADFYPSLHPALLRPEHGGNLAHRRAGLDGRAGWILAMPLNETQLALRWALTTAGVHDHLADILVTGHGARQIIEAVAYARSINARSVSAVTVNALMKGWKFTPPSVEVIRDTIRFLDLEHVQGVIRYWPWEKQA